MRGRLRRPPHPPAPGATGSGMGRRHAGFGQKDVLQNKCMHFPLFCGKCMHIFCNGLPPGGRKVAHAIFFPPDPLACTVTRARWTWQKQRHRIGDALQKWRGRRFRGAYPSAVHPEEAAVSRFCKARRRQVGDFDWAINSPYGDGETVAVQVAAGPGDGERLGGFFAHGLR